ncbi:hypothetical protein F5Y19DRAFT_102367 [Xylariaceae sp. FL1651]|nr:hypothetical protein F5Y19DRAFT_102367 [Xylariaceae sp. FL1651]
MYTYTTAHGSAFPHPYIVITAIAVAIAFPPHVVAQLQDPLGTSLRRYIRKPEYSPPPSALIIAKRPSLAPSDIGSPDVSHLTFHTPQSKALFLPTTKATQRPETSPVPSLVRGCNQNFLAVYERPPVFSP